MDELTTPSFIPQDDSNFTVDDRRIGFGRRFGALLLDSLVVLIVTIIVYYSIGDMLPSLSSAMLDMMTHSQPAFGGGNADSILQFMHSMAAFTVETIFVWLILSLLEIFMAASVGKMLVSIQIGGTDGHKAPVSSLALRWLFKSGINLITLIALVAASYPLYIVSRVVGTIVLLGGLMMLGSKKQALYDIVCETAVFQVRDIIAD